MEILTNMMETALIVLIIDLVFTSIAKDMKPPNWVIITSLSILALSLLIIVVGTLIKIWS